VSGTSLSSRPLPCPFCGGGALLDESTCRVRCGHYGCWLHEHVAPMPLGDWNRRTDAANAAADLTSEEGERFRREVDAKLSEWDALRAEQQRAIDEARLDEYFTRRQRK
jgi:hypothetical protein